MNYKLFYFIILFFSVNNIFFAFDLDSSEVNVEFYIVDAIILSGNDYTDDDIILRELTFSIRDSVNQFVLAYNKERIYSLGLFNRVDVSREIKEGANNINIKVEESWYIFPSPFITLRKNSIKSSTYGMQLTWKNFRGRNESIKSNVAFGYDPAFYLSYSNPNISYENSVSFFFDLAYGKFQNKSAEAELIYGEDFSYNYSRFMFGVGKRYSVFLWAGAYLGYEYFESPKYFPGRITISDGRIDRIILAGIKYSYDTRDLAQFANKGCFFSGSFLCKGFGVQGINYAILGFDFRQYGEIIGKISGKYRIISRNIIGGGVPFYDYSYLGVGDRIRGYYNYYFEGHNFYMGSVEVQNPIIEEWNFKFKLPLIPQSLTSYRIKIYGSLFSDFGTSYNWGDKFSLKKFNTGYGAGLTIMLLPYNALRIEYAFNEQWKGEFIVDTGFSF